MGAATRDLERRWKGGIVPFVVHSQMTNVETLRRAIHKIENHTVIRLGDSHGLAGEIQRHSRVARPYGALSATSDSNGNLFLIKWQIDERGSVSRFGDCGDRQAGRAHIVNSVVIDNANAPVITPVRRGSNSLFLVSWDDQPSNGELKL